MPNSIVTNAAANAAVRTLSSIGKDLVRTQSRVETGLRVAQSKDDPAVFAIALGMRGDMGGLQAVRDGFGFAKAVIGTAAAGANQVADELTKLRATVTQGQQQALDPVQIQAQVDAAIANIAAYVANADFNGVNLLNNGTDLTVVSNINGATLTVVSEDATLVGLGISGLQINSAAWTLTSDNTLTIANNETITVTAGGINYVFEFTDGTVPLTTVASPTVQVFDVQFTGAQSNLQIIGSLIARIQGQGFFAGMDNAGVVTIAGNNLTNVAVSGGLGGIVPAGGGGGAITIVDNAISLIGTMAANLGAAGRRIEGQEDFSAALMDSLKEGLGALVDADLADESAKLQALQTRNQLAIQSLSIANQGPQGLLALFRQ
jgi:flagellin